MYVNWEHCQIYTHLAINKDKVLRSRPHQRKMTLSWFQPVYGGRPLSGPPALQPPVMYEDTDLLPEVVALCDQRHCYLSCRLGRIKQCYWPGSWRRSLNKKESGKKLLMSRFPKSILGQGILRKVSHLSKCSAWAQQILTSRLVSPFTEPQPLALFTFA